MTDAEYKRAIEWKMTDHEKDLLNREVPVKDVPGGFMYPDGTFSRMARASQITPKSES